VRVLVVEDQAEMAEMVAVGLRRAQMAVDVALDGPAGLDRALTNDYDVIVLDRDLPGLHGDEVCVQLIAAGRRSRVLMLTAAADSEDLVDGLGLGADDYLAKPFDFPVLVARVRALARRAHPVAPPVLRVADLVVDTAKRRAARSGRPLQLGPKEFGVLELLMASEGRAVSAEELLERVWDEFTDPFTNAVAVTMSRLRAKLGDPPLIETVSRSGYRIGALPMPVLRPLLRVADRPHLPRHTIRLRLAALYGLLFTICGAALLVITNVLVRSATGAGSCHADTSGAVTCVIPDRNDRRASVVTVAGNSAAGGRRTAHGLSLLESGQNAVDLHQLLVYSWLALAIMAVVSVALGWLVAGRVLRPLRTITAAARSISATNLHERLALSGPDDELKELGDTFDDLLARLEQFIASQRQFVANASHELRTPLALQRTVIQLALADPDATMESLRAAHERVLASGAQQERLIEALLALTRGRAGLTKREPFDLAILAEQVLLTREFRARERSIEVRRVLAPALVAGDPRLAERLLANLADNALAYNSTPGRIDMMTGRRGDVAFVSITNTGPVVDAIAVDRLTRPFERLATERTGHADGSGLGLSIVQAIVNAHAGALTLRPRPGGGLTVEAAFPSTDSTADENPEPRPPRSDAKGAHATASRTHRPGNIEHWDS
jgi:DNA-binding response OmpR family regulator/signal transduction histidine kinase